MLLQVQVLQLRILNSYLLLIHGLPPEFDSFVDAIQFQIGSTTIDELHGLLLSKEIQLNNRKKASSATPFQAYSSYAGILPTPPNINPNSQAFTSQNFSNQGRGLDRNNLNHNYNQNWGNFRNNNNNNQRHNYYRNNNQRQNSNRGGHNNFQYSRKKISYQICRQFEHEAWDCPQRMNANYSAKSSHSTMVANTSNSTHTWLVDSVATYHVTNFYADL